MSSSNGNQDGKENTHTNTNGPTVCQYGDIYGRFGLPISRYLYDFEELNFVGSGKFSTVHKVRKRMDGWVYAIKKSKHPLLSSLEEREKLMEVYAHAALSACP